MYLHKKEAQIYVCTQASSFNQLHHHDFLNGRELFLLYNLSLFLACHGQIMLLSGKGKFLVITAEDVLLQFSIYTEKLRNI